MIRYLIAISIAFFLLPEAEAESPYGEASVGTTVIRGLAPVADLGAAWPNGLRGGDQWKADVTLIGSSRFQGADAPKNFAVRGLYVSTFAALNVGVGFSWMQNPRPFNGTNVNIALEVEYRMKRWPVTVTYAHMSDDNLKYPNYGRDLITIGYRFAL